MTNNGQPNMYNLGTPKESVNPLVAVNGMIIIVGLLWVRTHVWETKDIEIQVLQRLKILKDQEVMENRFVKVMDTTKENVKLLVAVNGMTLIVGLLWVKVHAGIKNVLFEIQYVPCKKASF